MRTERSTLALRSAIFLTGCCLPRTHPFERPLISGVSRCNRSAAGAINRVTGAWYEWLVAIAAWNYRVANPCALIAVPLPNVSQFDVLSLYVDGLYWYVGDLRNKVNQTAGVTLITSNPDLVLISPDIPDAPAVPNVPIEQLTPANLDLLDALRVGYVGRCRFQDIRGYIGVKASLRPDRRLQLPHEGSLMKAMYAHLQTREWIFDPPPLRYYGISTEVTQADLGAMQTVATHSIVSVQTIPARAVDALFVVDSFDNANAAFEQILCP
jgi:Cfr10I/Bse634I restriction endonuclease